MNTLKIRNKPYGECGNPASREASTSPRKLKLLYKWSGGYSLTAVPAKAEASSTGLELSVNSHTAVTSRGASGLTTLHKYAVFMSLMVIPPASGRSAMINNK
jgi:hypothetical protein